MAANREVHDGFVGTKRFPLNLVGADGVKAGDVLRATVWVKAANLVLIQLRNILEPGL